MAWNDDEDLLIPIAAIDWIIEEILPTISCQWHSSTCLKLLDRI